MVNGVRYFGTYDGKAHASEQVLNFKMPLWKQ